MPRSPGMDGRGKAAMTDARDRAIEALCDTIADLRKRIADLEAFARGATPAPIEATFPPGTQFFSDGRKPILPEPPTMADWVATHERNFGPIEPGKAYEVDQGAGYIPGAGWVKA